MSRLKFRSFQPNDAAAVLPLFIRSLRTVYPDFQASNWTKDLADIPGSYLKQGDFLIGLHDKKIIAMGALKWIDDGTCEMKRVVVDPAFQGKGIGQILLENLEARAQELGFSHIILDTTDKQVAAQHLYEKNGYNQTDRKVFDHPAVGYPLDVIYYQKDLPKD